LSSIKENNIEEKLNKKNYDSIQHPSSKPNEIYDPESINNKKNNYKNEIKEETFNNSVTTVEPKKQTISLTGTLSKPKRELTKVEKSSVYYWTEAEVDKWLNDQNIKASIIENISPCDGKLLDQLHQMSKEVPEFFFSCLRADSKASLKDVAYFTSELKSLFT
jgi:hypothetical protein